MRSPVTRSRNTRCVDYINAESIIRSYAKIGICVSRFFEDIETIQIYECLDTLYRFYTPFSLASDSSFYDLLQETEDYYSLKVEHRKAFAYISPNQSVLEIGCGSGLFLDSLKGKTKFVEGIELNDKALDKARGLGINATNTLIEDYAIDNHNKFDIVCSFQVLEHIVNVRDFIRSSLQCLKPGGKLIIGVPNNNPYLYRHDKFHALNLPPHHMGLWNKKSLMLLDKFFPLKVLNISTDTLATPGELIRFASVQSNYHHQHGNTIRACLWDRLRSLRPAKLAIPLRRTLLGSLEGRNVLAVFTKVQE